MAKVLCIIAWAGLATAAPYSVGRRAGSNVDTEAIINKVMGSLNLNQVIAEAMRGRAGSGTTFSGSFTQQPQVTLKTSGTRVGENSLSRFSGVSTQGGSSFSLQSQSGFGGSRSGSSADKTAVVGQVLNALNPQIEKAVADALRALSSSTSGQQTSSFGSSNQQSNSFGTTNQQSSFSSGSNQISGSSRQDASALVSQIISMLTPTITQSVKGALSSGQSSSVDQQSFMNSVSQANGFSSGSSSGVQQSSSSTGLNQNTLAQQVLTALGPTITSQVQAAIASMQSSSSSSSSQSNQQAFQQSQSLQVSEQETSRLVRQIITALTPSITSSVQSALRSQSQSTASVQQGSTSTFGSSQSSFGSTQSSSSAVDQSTLVTQIMSVLQPRIMSLVSDAIAAQEAAAAQAAAAAQQQAAAEQRRQAALVEQQRQAALREQQRQEAQRQAALQEQQRQAALIQQQRQAALREQQRIEAQRQAAFAEQQRQAAFAEQQRQAALLAAQQQRPSAGQTNLSSLFGSGHEVVHEIPGQSKVEYNIGMQGQLVGGVRRTNYN